MARKIIVLFFLFSTHTWGLTLKSSLKTYELKKNDMGYFVSPHCLNCTAWEILKSNKEKLKQAISVEKNLSLSIGTRACLGNKGAVWILVDENKNDVSICEFKDKSFLLTDDLALLARKLELH